MIIEDEELRDIYKTATSERLQKLEASLLRLEKQPRDSKSLDEFLREAHTLKGDSRMLGVIDVEKLTHQIEERVAGVRRGEAILNEYLFDRLYRGLDALRELIHEAVTGTKAAIDVVEVMARLTGEDGTETDSPSKISLETEDNSKDTFPGEESSFTPDTLETIRVESGKLDRLMGQTGELTVTNARIARQMTDIDDLIELYEDWQKEADGPIERHQKRLETLGILLDRLKDTATENFARLEAIAGDLDSGIRQLRLLPLSNLFAFFPRMVRDLAREMGKEIDLIIEGGDIPADKRIIEEMKDPILHILRNAIDHGCETVEERIAIGKPPRATIRLRGYSDGSRVGIEISDDGRGLDLEKIKNTAVRRGLYSAEQLDRFPDEQLRSLIFAPGFSTRDRVTEISGRGIGLDAVRNSIERLKGTLSLTSVLGMGCLFRIEIRATLATTSVLILRVAHLLCSLPVESVETVRLISREEISRSDGRSVMLWNDRPVTVAWLADLLEVPVTVPRSPVAAGESQKSIPCVVLRVGEERLALLVDEAIDQQEILIKPPCKVLQRIRNVTGSTILTTGEVCTLLNPLDLLETVNKGFRPAPIIEIEENPVSRKLLLVEDSIVIRTQLQRLLTTAGYEVSIATNGWEGLQKLESESFAAVVSDVEMPDLNGLEMTSRIRQQENYRDLPIVLVTTLATEEDKRRGAEAGANAYLTKGDFDQKILLKTLAELIENRYR
ncbi:response regulator [Pannus brasiliensis CCIBt3594]|uniref:histidine kinase n=1 Tax=Pannus brasiliensis CCIBt3594 TaxID=1427578 RepID=A0AAW9QVT3_9CHRO